MNKAIFEGMKAVYGIDRKGLYEYYSALHSRRRIPCCKDKDFMLYAVGKAGGSIAWASKELRNDKELAIAAIKKAPKAYDLLGEDAKVDRDVLLQMLSTFPNRIFELKNTLPDWIFRDRELMLAACVATPVSLKKIAAAFRKDKLFVLEVLQNSVRYNPRSYISYLQDPLKTLLNGTTDPASMLQSIIEKENLDARVAKAGIDMPKSMPFAL